MTQSFNLFRTPGKADPLSILGAAGVGLLLLGAAAKGLVWTVTIVKDLRDIPGRLKEVLEDLRRDVEAVQPLLTPELAARLNPEQHSRIMPASTELWKAINDLKQLLSPLVPEQGSPDLPANTEKRMLRLRRALVGVLKEKEVETKVERVQRLSESLVQTPDHKS
jgi:hypothetical protein